MSEARRIVSPGAGGERPREVPATAAVGHLRDSESLIELVEELAEAMVARNGGAIHGLLGDPRCARLPRDVREEAMVFSTLPEKSTRAPMRTLCHLHLMRELERGGETIPADQIELFDAGAARERRHMQLSRQK